MIGCVCVVNRGVDTLMQQAQGWESKGEYLRAIECYARVTTEVTSDPNVLQRCWVKVSDFQIFLCCLATYCVLRDCMLNSVPITNACLSITYLILNKGNVYIVFDSIL